MALTRVSYSLITGAPANVRDFGAVGDGVTNDTAAFAAAIATVANTGQPIYVPAGTYKITQELSTTGNLIIEGDGDSSVLDFSGTVTGGTGNAITVSGSLTALPDLGSAAAKGDQTLTFASAPSLAVSNVFVIYNPTNGSWSNFRADYRAGEWCEVKGISGTTVTVTNSLYDSYSTSAVDLYKLNSPIVELRNFKIVGTTIDCLILIRLCRQPLIENVTGYLESNSVITLDRCYQASAYNLNLFNKGDGGDDYALAIGNSQDVEVIGGNFYARRHAITTGGGPNVASVPCRNLRFTSLTTKNDGNSGVWSSDFHGNIEDGVYENCMIYGGATWQGKNVRYVNCVIGGIFQYASIYSAEIKGGYFTAENCTFMVSGDPQPFTRGIIDIGGNSDATTADTTERTTFIVKNCRIVASNTSAATSFVLFKNRGCTQNINFEIDGVTAISTTLFGQILFTQNVSGTAASEYIVVDNISGFPAGTYLHNADAGAYTNFPHRCQQQTGRVSLTATSGTASTVGSAINFNYVYPRAPSAQATTVGGLVGNRLAMASVSALTASALTPRIDSPDATNWTDTAARTVCWTACIDEA